MMEDVTILLLAGGDSTRLWPLGDKHLLHFFAKPLIWYSLSQISRNQGKKVVIVVNDKNKTAIETLSRSFPTLSITTVVQTDKRSMAGAILSSQKFLAGQRLLIINPSDIYDDTLFVALKGILRSDTPAVIAGTSVQSYFPGAYLTLAGNKIKSIVEKPDPANVPSNFISFVFDYFKSADLLLSSLSKDNKTRDDIFELTLNSMLNKGAQMVFLPYKGYWGYLKYPWHVLSICDYFLRKLKGTKIKKAHIAKSATITGDVYIEDNCRIMGNATVVGPTYIGRGSIIGNNSLVRESMIGDRCVVGYATEIVRSWIGNDSWFHTNYIGDSVVSRNTAMGAGTVLANFRLDEQTVISGLNDKKLDTGRVKLGSIIGENVRIGVNTSVMPGVKIGKNCAVSAGVCLDRDVPNESFVKLCKNSYEVSFNKRVKVKSTVRKNVLQALGR